jgi:uncharacterized protein YgbK (DUF1537 family)
VQDDPCRGDQSAGMDGRRDAIMSYVRMGVVADDITGSNDIGSMFAKNGYLTHVYPVESGAGSGPKAGSASGSGLFYRKEHQREPDILILDTDSRYDDSAAAYRKVFEATRLLQAEGYNRFFNKTCSVFRGNIGVEFDAMLDALERNFAVVVLGFPKNGRITRGGIHYVHGQPLSESPFRFDPMHPMLESDLTKILQSQTDRKVDSIPYADLKKGPDHLKKVLEVKRKLGGYIICDVTSQKSLHILAEVLADEPIICGSSALAETLPLVWGSPEAGTAELCLPAVSGAGVLCAAGSLTPQTKRQIRRFAAAGGALLELPSLELFSEKVRREQTAALSDSAADMIAAGRDVLVFASNDREVVAETKRLGEEQGYSPDEISRLVSGTLAEIIEKTAVETGTRRIVTAGGDTSAAVCRRLKINGLAVYKEIQPGLPSCLSIAGDPFFLVLKSGSFGDDDFLLQAIEHLRQSGSG